jgi:ABC-2 type transport system permease protein
MHAALVAAFVIAGKDLRQRLRDRSALVMGFLAPVAVAALISFAFSDTSFHATVAVVDGDRGPLATAFTTYLDAPELREVIDVTRAGSVADARRQIEDGDADAGLVIPPDFSSAAQGGMTPPITVLSSVDFPLATEVTGSIAKSFVAQLNADRLAVATAVAAGAPTNIESLTAEAAALRLPEQVELRAAGSKSVTPINYFAPGMAIMFMFFAIGFGARSYALERQGGTLDRITAAPLRPIAVLAGKALATFVYGVASLGTVALVTSLVFGADWGPPLAVAALVVAMALTLVCLTMLVIAATRTDRQADGLASILAFGLALLGGNFVYIGAAPPVVHTLALFTPNGWALRAFTDLSGGAGWTAIVQPVLAILAFCALVTAAVALLARRGATP